MHHVTTEWVSGLHFISDIEGHKVHIDVPERAGGKDEGTIPKPLLLAALSGCTGMDVAAMLSKSAHPPTAFQVEVDGDLTERHPITYKNIVLRYRIEGATEGQADAIAAVRKSFERICGVAHLLKQVVPIQYSIFYNQAHVFEAQTEPTSTHA